jgi:integrase
LCFDTQESLLRHFDKYIVEQEHEGPLTEQFVLTFSFACSGTGPNSTLPARRYLVVRHFTEYLATFEPNTPRLNPKAILLRHKQPPAYIFTEQELKLLLSRCFMFPLRHPVSNASLHAMIGLAASSGLRLGEVMGLDLADVNLETKILTIRHSKLDKDRWVPVHVSTLEVLRQYRELRDQTPQLNSQSAFFLNSRLQRYQTYNVAYLFRRLVGSMDLHCPQGKRPTFRSLRHTFAVHRLAAWHRAGEQTQALLPALATYMGHVHYTSTAYYLTATAEMLGIAAERLELDAPEVAHGQAT